MVLADAVVIAIKKVGEGATISQIYTNLPAKFRKRLPSEAKLKAHMMSHLNAKRLKFVQVSNDINDGFKIVKTSQNPSTVKAVNASTKSPAQKAWDTRKANAKKSLVEKVTEARTENRVPDSTHADGIIPTPVESDLTQEDISTDNKMTIDYMVSQMDIAIKKFNSMGIDSLSPEMKATYNQILRDKSIVMSLTSGHIPQEWQKDYLHDYKSDINYFKNLSPFINKHIG